MVPNRSEPSIKYFLASKTTAAVFVSSARSAKIKDHTLPAHQHQLSPSLFPLCTSSLLYLFPPLPLPSVPPCLRESPSSLFPVACSPPSAESHSIRFPRLVPRFNMHEGVGDPQRRFPKRPPDFAPNHVSLVDCCPPIHLDVNLDKVS